MNLARGFPFWLLARGDAWGSWMYTQRALDCGKAGATAPGAPIWMGLHA